jgi:hypothetical protein
MARWHNIRVRGDLYEMLFHRATSDRRSVAQMTDVLLTRALERETNMPASSGGGPSREVFPGESGHGVGVGRGTRRERDASSLKPAEPASSSARASVREIEGQTTVDEMLASCPQCAGELRTVDVTRGGSTIREGAEACVDCGWVREPTGGGA